MWIYAPVLMISFQVVCFHEIMCHFLCLNSNLICNKVLLFLLFMVQELCFFRRTLQNNVISAITGKMFGDSQTSSIHTLWVFLYHHHSVCTKSWPFFWGQECRFYQYRHQEFQFLLLDAVHCGTESEHQVLSDMSPLREYCYYLVLSSNIRVKGDKMKRENNPIRLPLETWCSLFVPQCAASNKGNWNSWCLYRLSASQLVGGLEMGHF